MRTPFVPPGFLTSISDAQAEGLLLGRSFAASVLALLANEEPMKQFWLDVKPSLSVLSPAQRIACVEAAVLTGLNDITKKAPALTEKGRWHPIVLRANVYDPIFEAARASEMEYAMPLDNLIAALALRADALSMDFALKGYEGQRIDRNTMHALAVAAYSLDPGCLALAVEFLPTIAAQAAYRIPAQAHTLGAVWDGLKRHPAVDSGSVMNIVKAETFMAAVYDGFLLPARPGTIHHALMLEAAGRCRLPADVLELLKKDQGSSPPARSRTLH